MKQTLLPLLLSGFLLASNYCKAQIAVDTIEARRESIGEVHSKLLLPPAKIRNDVLLNESVLDLVNPWVTDSIIKKKTERHHVPIAGTFTRIFGFRWIRTATKKEKFIGTTYRNIRIPSKDQFTEYDIIIDLAAHLPFYFERQLRARQMQVKMNKRMKEKDITKPPFVKPDSSTNLNIYRMHCEHTPMVHNRDSLHAKFYPCLPGGSYLSHRNYGVEFPSFGMYGPLCLDCNHSCHPEIHPYEWIWWLRLNPLDDPYPDRKTWCFALMREGSNRFRHWSKKKPSGSISIPFAFRATVDTFDIELEHLVRNKTDSIKFSKMDLPKTSRKFKAKSKNVAIELDGKIKHHIRFRNSGNFATSGAGWWIDGIRYDSERDIFAGNFHFATSVNELYALRVNFSPAGNLAD